MTVNIFPVPRRVSRRRQNHDLDGHDWIVCAPEWSHALLARAVELAAEAAVTLQREIRVARARPSGAGVLIAVTQSSAIPAQGFELIVDTAGVHLAAGDDAGAFYGLTACLQLLEQFGRKLPGLKITDHPDHRVRGVMLDVSRCKVPTMVTLKLLIDRLARLRCNQLQLYMEHTFAFAAHQIVWSDASPLTHEEINELDAYCAERFIDLVPNFNSFGHFERWLRHPDYRHLAECPDGFSGYSPRDHGTTLAPRRQSLQFLHELYDELLPNFSSRLLNAGCDETWELGKGWSRRKAEAHGTTRVYLDFLKQIYRLAKKKGSRMMFWGDIILREPQLIPELPKDLIALAWGYEADHPLNRECRAFARSGLQFYVAPGTSSWNSITGRTTNCLNNLLNAADAGVRNGASGFLITDWGDGGHHQTLPVSYAGFAAGAAYSWCLKSNRDVDLAVAINRTFFGYPSSGLGELWLDLGRTIDQVPGTAAINRTMINTWVFAVGTPDVSGVTATGLRRGLRWLDGLEERMTGCYCHAPDADLVTAELNHAIDMARFGLLRALAARQRTSSGSLLQQQRRVIMQHEEIWLQRNRPGGLHESSERLRSAKLA